MYLNTTYIIQKFDKKSGHWINLEKFTQDNYDGAVRGLYKKYNLSNSADKLRLIQLKEELIDIVYPKKESSATDNTKHLSCLCCNNS